MPVIPVIQKVIGRMVVQGVPRPKVSRDLISTNKLDIVAHLCNTRYTGDISRRIVV
jgi:hypothetical protein